MFRHVHLLVVLSVWLGCGVALRAAEGEFDSKGVKIHYVSEGDGEPVILIHGFTGQGGFWKQLGVATELAKEYRVIAIDCRGHGQSGKPHDPKAYGQEMVEDVVRLMDHLKLRRAHVVGYSMGGFITMKLVADHPDRLLSATIGGAGGVSPVDDGAREEIAKSLEERKSLKPLFDRILAKDRPRPPEEQIKAFEQAVIASNDVKALAAVMRGMAGLVVPDVKFKTNKVPAQCVIGEYDPLKVGVDAIKDKMTNLRIVVIPDTDHVTAGSSPMFLQSVKEFLAKHRQKG
jgi:pimeloyl-ACP methyl ester carboxylesterase